MRRLATSSIEIMSHTVSHLVANKRAVAEIDVAVTITFVGVAVYITIIVVTVGSSISLIVFYITWFIDLSILSQIAYLSDKTEMSDVTNLFCQIGDYRSLETVC